jgi:phosphatidate cytidylyltransferase
VVDVDAKPRTGPDGRPLAAATPQAADVTPDPVGSQPASVPPGGGVGRAGRDLRAAIVVVYRPAFVAVVGIAVAIGLVELAQAFRTAGRRVSLVPVLVGAAATLATGYAFGSVGLLASWLLTVVAVVLWRLAGPVAGYLADVAVSSLASVYVPFLAGFAVLLLRQPDGGLRALAFIATVVFSDVGGYAAGVLFGRHPMAPTVSPKKSWEGFAGSVLACVAVGAVLVSLLPAGTWWQGALFGLAMACVATLGDLGESMIKRDLGIKDMGRLLPGHGGVMDRLDSLLPAAPVAWLVLSALVPPS